MRHPYIHIPLEDSQQTSAVPNLRAHNLGRDVLLAFDQHIGDALKA